MTTQVQTDIQSKIISELSSTKSSSSIDVKKLRKIILFQLQTDSDDKDAKKSYKKAVKALESDGKISLNAEGLITLLISNDGDGDDGGGKKKKKKDKKKKKKRDKSEDEDGMNQDDDNDGNSSKKKQKMSNENDEEENQDDDNEENENSKSGSDAIDRNKPCKGNPLGVTRIFVGNLPFAVDETSLREFASPAIITHIKWITDKETGKFYGSAFIEMKHAKDAAIIVTERNGEKLMGRPLKINYAPARDGDVWPPKSKEITGNGGQAGGSGVKAMIAKPDNCVKLFMGNLSFDIDDDTIVKFFANVDAEVKAVRWLHHKDSGDFKGCGYAEFWNTEACEKAATLNGKTLLGRPIRIDWAE